MIKDKKIIFLFPKRKKMHDKGLMMVIQKLTQKVCQLDNNTDELESLLKVLNNVLVGEILKEGYKYLLPGSTGTIGAGLKSYSIHNIGVTDALVDGEIFPSGISIDFASDRGDVFTGIPYETQLTTLIITDITV